LWHLCRPVEPASGGNVFKALGKWLSGSDKRTVVYTYLGKDKQPLYIGRTTDMKRRSKEHSKKVWFPGVEKVETKNYRTLEKAARAEKKAIKKKGPKYNIVHNRKN
jgi:predicted GIY-YIG superfamily endonuclease